MKKEAENNGNRMFLAKTALASITNIINSFLSAIILILIFYLIVTPIGLVLRLCGKDLLGLKGKKCDSYWISKESVSNKDSYLKQY